MSRIAFVTCVYEVKFSFYRQGICGGNTEYLIAANDGDEAADTAQALIQERFPSLTRDEMTLESLKKVHSYLHINRSM